MIRTRARTAVGAGVVAFVAVTTAVSAAAAPLAESSDSTATTTASDDSTAGDTTDGGSGGTTTDSSAGSATAPTGSAGSTAPAATVSDEPTGDWQVSTDNCTDPDAANAPIEDTILIGSSMPLSGGPAAAAYAPVAQGWEAYIDYANENELVPGITLEVSIGDDQFNPELTPGVVEGLLDEGASVISEIIGSGGNLAVRDLLNEECVPQVLNASGSPVFEDVENYPWTTGGLVNYTVESQIYADDIKANYPDGATLGLYYANYEFGQAYQRAFTAIAADESAGLEIVSEQTVEPTDGAPPQSQVSALADAKPDAIVGVPVGAQCPVFLQELANAVAANPDWTPRVYLSQVCASATILGAAGDAADGVLLGSTTIDLGDPATFDTNEAAANYRTVMEASGRGDVIVPAAPGWTAAEVTVEAIRRAAASSEGLTRASIINTFRSMEYHPSLFHEGINMRLNGEQDAASFESLQVVSFNAADLIFEPAGDVITDFESE